MLSSEECDKLEVWGLSLHTTYKYNLQYSNSFNQTDRLKVTVCFRSLYNNICYADREEGQNIISQASLTIQVGIKPQLNYKKNYDNLTVLTLEEIKTFLDELVSIFTYKNTTVTYSIETVDTDWIDVVIKATNIQSFYIKFIAAYIRYMYETPCNWILKEACLLKEQNSRFKDYPLFSIFVFLHNITSSCHAYTVLPTSGVRPLLTIEQLQIACNQTINGAHAIDAFIEKTYKTSMVSKGFRTLLNRYRDAELIRNYIAKGILSAKTLKLSNQMYNILVNNEQTT